MRGDIEEYIEARYERWLDYAKFHTSLAGIGDEAYDVLNEVLVMLLDKPEVELDGLISSRHGRYTELDFYVLKMIKLNATSDTSPYRHRYKPIPSDDNVDWRRLNISCEEDDAEDNAAYVADRMRMVREALDSMQLADKARRIFCWKFFAGESFADWPGKESKKELYATYKEVMRGLIDKINGRSLF